MSTLARYRAFVAALRRRHRRCQVCRGTPRQLREPLRPHHVIPVKITGARSVLATGRRNVLAVCSSCHRLFHPLCRHYLWEGSSQTRARALR